MILQVLKTLHPLNLHLTVNSVHQAKHQAVVILSVPHLIHLAAVKQALLAKLLLVNQVHLVVLQALVLAHLLVVPVAVNLQVAPVLLRVPRVVQVLPVHLVQVVVNPAPHLVVHLVRVAVPHPQAVLLAVRPVVALPPVHLAKRAPLAVALLVRCQLTQFRQFTRDVHTKTTIKTIYMTHPLLHQLVPLKY